MSKVKVDVAEKEPVIMTVGGANEADGPDGVVEAVRLTVPPNPNRLWTVTDVSCDSPVTGVIVGGLGTITKGLGTFTEITTVLVPPADPVPDTVTV